jgi:hypothetical protein
MISVMVSICGFPYGCHPEARYEETNGFRGFVILRLAKRAEGSQVALNLLKPGFSAACVT